MLNEISSEMIPIIIVVDFYRRIFIDKIFFLSLIIELVIGVLIGGVEGQVNATSRALY